MPSPTKIHFSRVRATVFCPNCDKRVMLSEDMIEKGKHNVICHGCYENIVVNLQVSADTPNRDERFQE